MTPPRLVPRSSLKSPSGLPRLLAIAVVFSLLGACSPTVGRFPFASGPATPVAPDFSFTTFDGSTLGLADLAGSAVVANFWASWCQPCRAEMPDLEATYRSVRERGVAFVGLAVQDDSAASRALVDELGITYPAGPDLGNEIGLRYQVTGLPTTVFIGRDGRIARRWTGPISAQQLIAWIDEIAQ